MAEPAMHTLLDRYDDAFAATQDSQARLSSGPVTLAFDVQLDDGSDRSALVADVLGVELPAAVGQVSRADGREVLWLGPREWLVLAPVSDTTLGDDLATAAGDAGSAVDVSAQRCTLRLEGADARAVLAHGCSMDLHPSVVASGTAWQTQIALTGAVVMVDAPDVYRLLVRTSFARYLADWLLDARTEY